MGGGECPDRRPGADGIRSSRVARGRQPVRCRFTGPAGAVSGGALGPHAGAEARWGLVVMGWSRPHVSDGGGIGVQVRFPGPRAWPHAMTASNVTVAAAVLLTRSRRNLTAVPPGRVTVVARQQGMTARPRARQAGLGCTVTGKS